MLVDARRSVLVLVDYQVRLMPAIDQGERVLQEALFLAEVAGILGIPILGTEQNPAGLGPNDPRLRALCRETLPKMHFNGAADGLTGLLHAQGRTVETVVIAGCESHVCLLQTAIGLLRSGLRVAVVPAASGSRHASDKDLAMQRLAHAGAAMLSPEMVAFEWLGSSDHPRFRAVLDCIKRRDAFPCSEAPE